MIEMCAVPPWRVSSAPLVEWRRKLKSCRSFGTGFSGKGNWNGEVIVLDELEVVDAVGDNGRFGAKVYGVEVSRLGNPIFCSSTYLGRYGISGDVRFDGGPSTKAGECVGVVLPAFMGSAWVIDD